MSDGAQVLLWMVCVAMPVMGLVTPFMQAFSFREKYRELFGRKPVGGGAMEGFPDDWPLFKKLGALTLAGVLGNLLGAVSENTYAEHAWIMRMSMEPANELSNTEINRWLAHFEREKGLS